ncbi:hypothetical protein FKW77_000750 [Venturia effusa]|uniref:Rhodopsin domain-containing protein n=1 Tax=Venturia effusa TaxID=50376 RepID=A0A517L0S8_9PEZI|nr:hypothetical protein FKW77_000750 [Venturia effusa]
MCNTPMRDRSNVIFAAGFVAGSVALISVSVRTLHSIMQGKFGLDDVFALAAEAACLAVTVIQCITPKLGFGKDTWVVPQQNIYKVLRLTYGSQISYFICHGLTKLAFLFLYLRIFGSARSKLLIWGSIFASVFYTIGFASTMIFACWPISAAWTSWDGTTTPNYCINQNTFYLVAAAVNIGLDFAIVLIPIPELIMLKLSVRKKVVLIAMFGVGTITIVVSFIRLSVVAKYATSTNPMYDNLMSGVYSILEINVGIICLSLPAFYRFLVVLVPKCFGSIENESKPGSSGHVVPHSRQPSKPTVTRQSRMTSSLFNTTISKPGTEPQSRPWDDDQLSLVDLPKSEAATTTPSFGESTAGSECPCEAPTFGRASERM